MKAKMQAEKLQRERSVKESKEKKIREMKEMDEKDLKIFLESEINRLENENLVSSYWVYSLWLTPGTC